MRFAPWLNGSPKRLESRLFKKWHIDRKITFQAPLIVSRKMPADFDSLVEKVPQAVMNTIQWSLESVGILSQRPGKCSMWAVDASNCLRRSYVRWKV